VKVLVAEDDYTSRVLLETMLRGWGHEVLTAEDGDGALRLIAQHDDLQLLVLDWIMPGRDGPDICRAVRAAVRQNYVYIILLTAKTEREAFLEGMESGADDYIIKPFDAEQMRARLRVAERIVQLEERLSSQNEALRLANEQTRQLLTQVQAQAIELERQAREDWLTGLYNRRHLDLHLQREFVRARRYQSPLTVAIADLDNFKSVNDRFSHHVGDEVLRTLADILQSNSRSTDIVGRYGGEEFVIILPETTREQGLIVCEKIRRTVEEYNWSRVHEGLRMTVSVGMSSDTSLANYEKMLTQADDRLYEAKRAGKNTVRG
jgi:diguanylate cyclase (GGDEF)-like protein